MPTTPPLTTPPSAPSEDTPPSAPSNNKKVQWRSVALPVVGLNVPMPTAETALYYGGVAALAAAEIIEWPIALVVIAGHEMLRRSRRSIAGKASKAAESAES